MQKLNIEMGVLRLILPNEMKKTEGDKKREFFN